MQQVCDAEWEEHPQATEVPFLCPRKFSSTFKETKTVLKKNAVICPLSPSGESLAMLRNNQKAQTLRGSSDTTARATAQTPATAGEEAD